MKCSEVILIVKTENEPIPYPLLLLADESIYAIDKYIHQCRIYLIKSRKMTVGVCAIQEVDACTIEIKNLAVSEKFRNCGVGSSCLQEIETIYPLKNILVGTGDGSVDAIRFYRKNGFEAHAIRKNFFLNNYKEPILENGLRLRDQIVFMKKKNSIR
jgi:aminoglycoside 6'-N-acetyltransferase I